MKSLVVHSKYGARTRVVTSSSNSQNRNKFSRRLPKQQHHSEKKAINPVPTLSLLAFIGATTGTFLDTIHTRVGLLQYDQLPVDLGNGVVTSMVVPILLAVFYMVVGGLVLASDDLMMYMEDSTTKQAIKNANLSRMALSFGSLSILLATSSLMYQNGLPYAEISVVLAFGSAVNFLLFDGTKQGLLLAVFCALTAPVFELVLMQQFNLWHYPRGDLFTAVNGGFVSWVPWCYFFYTPALCSLTRYLKKTVA